MSLKPKRSRSIFEVVGSSLKHRLDEFGLDTTLVELQVRDRFTRLGQRMPSVRVPPAVISFWEFCKKYGAENPMKATTILALVITCAAPVIVFLSFALITFLVTFIGFLFVEGTLLGIASVFFGGILLMVGIFTLTGVFFGLLGCLVVSKLYTLATGDTQPQRYLTKLPFIGSLFANMDHTGANGDAVKILNDFEEDNAESDESYVHSD